ncbi:ankyrin repeat protein [Paraburkholderia fungorum]|uniref:ankyrin repeat domain-containing protein n=1 Tax=Paraburkholderia fungorum TaxID=134537 RepID=UPI000D4A4F03|nr:ankyrin repeat domain-containing protein [Paraburkholderia fungorum]PRZ56446.1 ankyrin repeat protein [Paraburkholderia fungorum]
MSAMEGMEMNESERLTALSAAARTGDLEALRAALAHGDARLRDVAGGTPMFEAVRTDHPAAIEMLLPHSDPHAVRKTDGLNAFLYAASLGRARCLAALLPASDPAAVDGLCGVNALGLAARHGSDDSVALLAGVCDPLAQDPSGKTPLMWAAINGNWRMALTLLPICDPHARDENGNTALAWAARLGDTKCVRALLWNGDPSVADHAGRYPMTHAAVAVAEAPTEAAERCVELLAEVSGPIQFAQAGAALRSAGLSKLFARIEAIAIGVQLAACSTDPAESASAPAAGLRADQGVRRSPKRILRA